MIYEHPFLKCQIYRWEDLSAYFGEEDILDDIFDNPRYSLDERKKILYNTNLTKKQKNFLLEVYDIDCLTICKNEVFLVEDKSKDVEGKEFNRRQCIYLDHGTNTQHLNLKKASELGIQAGILLNLAKYRKSKIDTEIWKYYPIQDLIYMKNSNRTKIIVDDFILKGRELGKN